MYCFKVIQCSTCMYYTNSVPVLLLKEHVPKMCSFNSLIQKLQIYFLVSKMSPTDGTASCTLCILSLTSFFFPLIFFKKITSSQFGVSLQCSSVDCRGRSFTPERSSPMTETIDWQTVRLVTVLYKFKPAFCGIWLYLACQ